MSTLAAPLQTPQTASLLPKNGRVLIEFPDETLRLADQAARQLQMTRAEFIRHAVRFTLASMEEQQIEAQLEASCRAHAEMNLNLLDEFATADREGWQ